MTSTCMCGKFPRSILTVTVSILTKLQLSIGTFVVVLVNIGVKLARNVT